MGTRSLVCYIERYGLVERLALSPVGLLVAAGGRLGQRLRSAAADEPPDQPPDGPDLAPGGWRTAAAWLYVCVTLVPTVVVVPAVLVPGAPAWRFAVGAAGLVTMLVLLLAYGWAAPALQVRRHQVVGTTGRDMLRAGHEAVDAVRLARRNLGTFAEPVPPSLLDRALWELAGVLAAEERAGAARRRAQAALDRLTADEPEATELRSRHAALAQAERALRTEAAHRLASLRELAVSCRQLAAECEAVTRANLAASAADVGPVGLAPTGVAEAGCPGDPVAGPAELMAATLEAYRRRRGGSGQ
jgi:hypothetical protein